MFIARACTFPRGQCGNISQEDKDGNRTQVAGYVSFRRLAWQHFRCFVHLGGHNHIFKVFDLNVPEHLHGCEHPHPHKWTPSLAPVLQVYMSVLEPLQYCKKDHGSSSCRAESRRRVKLFEVVPCASEKKQKRKCVASSANVAQLRHTTVSSINKSRKRKARGETFRFLHGSAPAY